MQAAHQRYGAKRAGIVATLRDLQVGEMGWRGELSLAEELFPIVDAELTNDLGEMMRSEIRVNVRYFCSKVFRKSLRQAPHHDDLLELPLILPPHGLKDRIDRLLLRRLDEATGIDDCNVRAIDIFNNVSLPPDKLTKEHFTIDRVFRAP